VDSNSLNPRQILNHIDKKIDTKVPYKPDKRFPAMVVTNNNDGSAVVHLATDPLGNNITVQNSRELALKTGSQITVIAIHGDLNNAFIDTQKGYTNNNIYADFINGSDSTGDGTEVKPFKTIQHIIDILPKSLSGRYITIFVKNASETEVILIEDFYGSGEIYIKSYSGSNITIDSIDMYNNQINIKIEHFTFLVANVQSGAAITVVYGLNVELLYCISTSSVLKDGIDIMNTRYVRIDHCTMSNKYDGILVNSGSSVEVSNCTLSNNGVAIDVSYISTVFSDTNTGSGNDVGLSSYYCSTIGKYDSAQPSGTFAEDYDSSSIIR
jgi:parallel beta-helix repeat protein